MGGGSFNLFKINARKKRTLLNTEDACLNMDAGHATAA